MFNRSTRYFGVFAVCVLVGYLWLISLPAISNQLLQWIGTDPLTWIGSGGVYGPKKITLFQVAGWGAAGLVVAGLVISLLKPGRLYKMIIAAAVLPILFAGPYWVGSLPYGQTSERVHMGHLPSVEYGAIFNDANIQRNDVKTFAGLFQNTRENYRRWRTHLASKWGIEDEEKLKALFALNTASHFFRYGNQDPEAPGGCAVLNEQSNFTRRDRKQLGVAFYTQSDIGCCSDYAALLRFLLDGFGLENRVVGLPVHGHFLNEVKIGGAWHALDAQTGFFYSGAWDEIAQGDAPFVVTAFPVPSLDLSAPRQYRTALNAFQKHILHVAANGAELADYSKPLSVYD